MDARTPLGWYLKVVLGCVCVYEGGCMYLELGVGPTKEFTTSRASAPLPVVSP